MLDVLIASAYGIDLEDFRMILRGCDFPAEVAASDAFARTADPKGFWRVDKDQDPELRHTVLAQVAYHDFRRLGLDAFLSQNDGEGWMIPETLRLTDYGLGLDDRAKEHQPVAARLGSRFLPWQLDQGVDESWEECAHHAANIEALLGIGQDTPQRVSESPPQSDSADTTDLLDNESPTDLFGEPVASPKRRKR